MAGRTTPTEMGMAPSEMSQKSLDSFQVIPRYQALFQSLGLTAQTVFTDPRIVVWRSITERENCTLDVEHENGEPIRLHVKRYRADGVGSAAEDEVRGISALERHGIPTAPLVAHGQLADGRSFIITEDLGGFGPADKLVAGGVAFETILEATADLAARLHEAGLHHRDLYLCHFFVKSSLGAAPELRLIDAARVKDLPGFLTRRRWIVKDLAQFWYSTLALSITDEQRERWLARYGEQRRLRSVDTLRRAIERKMRSIARHDQRLKNAQPTRNISIPGS